MNPDILIFIIKLVLGGIVGFLAILVMSKTRDASWMCIVIGFLLSYAAIVYDLMVKIGVLTLGSIFVLGIPLPTLISIILPNIFFILAFIFKLAKK